MAEQTILVALTVEADERPRAMEQIAESLKQIGPMCDNVFGVTSWWIAEDDRIDGSDNDSAVFVHPGLQHEVSANLFVAGYTSECNVMPEKDPTVNPNFNGEEI